MAEQILSGMSPVEQEIYIKKLSKELKIAEGAIRMELSGNDNMESVPRQSMEKRAYPDDGITSMEKTLLKLMATEESYIDKITQYPGILESDFSLTVYDFMKEEYETYHRVDLNKLMEELSDDGAMRLQAILDDVAVGGNEEQVFLDCVETYRKRRLAREEKRLITLLSVAEEEKNQDRIRELTDQLMKVQKERKNQS